MEPLKLGADSLEATQLDIDRLLESKKDLIDSEIAKLTQEAVSSRNQDMKKAIKDAKSRKKPNLDNLKKKSHDSKKYKQKINKKVGRTIEEKVKGICKRQVGSIKWIDQTMVDWPDDDFRIFVGDLGNEVNDEHLARAFSKYSTFLKARVVRDKRTNKTKGFGFVSMGSGDDYMRAMKEMNGVYLGKRPLKLMKSKWKNRFKK